MVTFRKLESTITGTVNGKPFNVPRTKELEVYLGELRNSKEPINTEEVLKHLRSSRSIVIAGSNKYLAFNPVTKEYFLELDGNRSKHAIPQTLVEFIENSYNKDVDFMPVIKAWARLLSNVRYTEVMADYFSTYLSTTFVDQEEADRLVEELEIPYEVAANMATYQDISITQEGLLATYKVAELVTWKYVQEKNEETGEYKTVKMPKYEAIPDTLDPTTGDVLEKGGFEKPPHIEDLQFTPAIWKDGDKFFSGDQLGYVYEVGKQQYLPKDSKRNLNHTSGGGGLYSGGLEYIRYFRSGDRKVLTCFVDPADILSFQSEGHAFRTDALMPNNVWDETIPLKGTYHSSDYGKLSQKRLDKLVADAIAEEKAKEKDE